MTAFRQLPVALVMAGAMALAGCGGGGSSTPTEAEGMWTGSTGDGRAITGFVFENGLYYILYSSTTDDSTIAGVVQGTGSTSGANFSSRNARDFNLEGAGVLSGTVEASFAARASLAGTVTYGPGLGNTFTATYDSDYELTPTMAAVEGTYLGEVASSAGMEVASVAIEANGDVSGIGESGCSVTGTVSPRARGNAYTVTLRFGGAPCLFANQTLKGIGYYDPMTKRFVSATPNGSRTDGILFLGEKLEPMP